MGLILQDSQEQLVKFWFQHYRFGFEQITE